MHDVALRPSAYGLAGSGSGSGTASTSGAALPEETATEQEMQAKRAALLAKVNSFTPHSTVFEVGTKGPNPLSDLMRDRRATLDAKRAKAVFKREAQESAAQSTAADTQAPERGERDAIPLENLSQAGESDIEASLGHCAAVLFCACATNADVCTFCCCALL